MLSIDLVANTNELTKYNAMGKFILSMAMLALCIVLDNPVLNLAISILCLLIIVFIGRISIKYYSKLLIIPSTFIILGLLTILLTEVSNVDRSSIIFAFNILKYKIGVTEFTLKLSSAIIFRSMGSISSIYLLMLSTPANQIIDVFKKLRLPIEFIELYMLCYRFIFLLLDEIKVIMMAQELRFGYTNLKTSYRSFSNLVAIVFIRTYERYKSMEISLELKLYEGDFY